MHPYNTSRQRPFIATQEDNKLCNSVTLRGGEVYHLPGDVEREEMGQKDITKGTVIGVAGEIHPSIYVCLITGARNSLDRTVGELVCDCNARGGCSVECI